jgi:hypothetical protein
MKILTEHNTTFDLDTVPDQIDDMRYCVLDASDKEHVDFFWLPLIFLESFYAPAICLQIGAHNLQVPMDWSILICDDDYSALEVLPLTSLNNRGFSAVTFNPLQFQSITGAEISITNIYNDVKWYFPKLKHGHLLTIPLDNKPRPSCIYLVKDVNKVCDLEPGDLM